MSLASFVTLLEKISPEQIAELLAKATLEDARRALAAPRLTLNHIAAIFSEAALPLLEQMAQKAKNITSARFGRTVNICAPLYLSNYCVNSCAYCGFAGQRSINRRCLSLEEAQAQAQLLFAQGIRHLLLVTGEAPQRYGLDDIIEVAKQLRPRAASLSVEIFPCREDGYRRLSEAGVDGLTIYQETYDQKIYQPLHPRGPKSEFAARLMAAEAGGQAEFRSLGIGALLGLAPPRQEAVYLALHGAYLAQKFPRSRLAFSFPRLRPIVGGFAAADPASDAQLVQFVVGIRLLFPDAEIVISTREPAALRDRLLNLGATRLSAGSCTNPGGYGQTNEENNAGDQFITDDQRSIAEVVTAVSQAGFDPVTKDFDPAFLANSEEKQING